MRIYDLREYIFDVVGRYFTHARVVWSDEVKEKPRLPMVMLTFRNLSTTTFSETVVLKKSEDGIEDDGAAVVHFFPSSVALEVNNFTKRDGSGRNNALPDLYEFVKFLNSDEIVDKMFADDISIVQNGPIQPVSMVFGQDHEYRAMAEFTVNFTQISAGAYGIMHPDNELVYDCKAQEWRPYIPETENDWKPTSSGGGDYELENSAAYIFSEAEVEMRENKEE